MPEPKELGVTYTLFAHALNVVPFRVLLPPQIPRQQPADVAAV